MTAPSPRSGDGLAVFDFDGTFVPFQSPDAFVAFAVSRARPRGAGRREFVRKVFLKTAARVLPGRVRSAIHKRLVLRKIRGMSETDVEASALAFYRERIRPALRPEVVSKMEECRKAGCRIWLVSASYDPYLVPFCRDFRIDRLIATRIRFRKGVCTGRIEGRDVAGDEKVRRIDALLSAEDWRPGRTEAVSDSASDLPLLRWARVPVVVHPASAKPSGFPDDWACKLIPCTT